MAEIPNTHTIEMPKESDKKGSVKYASSDPNAVVTNIYLSRKAYDPMPDKIFVTISEDPIESTNSTQGKKAK